MSNFKECSECLYNSNHPFGLTFNKEGVCSGCTTHKEKFSIDWEERLNKLRKQIEPYRSKANLRNYDCVVPVEGNAGSFYVLHLVKNVLGLNPLCVHYNSHFNSSEGIWNLSNLRMSFDVDIISYAISSETVKKICRHTLQNFQSIYWHAIAGRTSFPVQVALDYEIPLIFWGYHQGVEQSGMFSHFDEIEMTERYRHNFDLMRFNPEDLVRDISEINDSDISTFKYPDIKDLERIGIRGIYLNNYFMWDHKIQHIKMNKTYRVKGRENPRVWDKFENSDCLIYSDYHDFLKFSKLGYTKLTDQLNREIRFNRMSKIKANSIINRKRNLGFDNIRSISEFLSASEEAIIAIGYLSGGLKNSINLKSYFDKINYQTISKETSFKILGKGYP
jgi:N-acetyl sugar amidotransferase